MKDPRVRHFGLGRQVAVVAAALAIAVNAQLPAASTAAAADTLHACSEAGLDDALSAGGGPHLFDCDGQTTIVTSADKLVAADVIIDGSGKLTVAGDGSHRLFSVGSGVELTLRGMTLTAGRADVGGAIHNAGAIRLENTVVSGNTADELGGAIFNLPPASGGTGGAVTLTGTSAITGNQCLGDANAGVYPTGRICGAGIWNAGTFSEGTPGRISANTPDNCAALVGGGLDVRAAVAGMCPNGTVLVPAGVHAISGEIVLARPVNVLGVLYENRSVTDGEIGSRDLEHTLLELHSMMSVLEGDGVGRLLHVAVAASAEIRNLYLTGGHATGDGGAILNDGFVLLEDSVVEGNRADGDGGGIFTTDDASGIRITAGARDVAMSLVIDNEGRCGGGLATLGPTMITNTLVESNTAHMCGGGAWFAGPSQVTSTRFAANTLQGARRGEHPGGGLLVSSCRSDGGRCSLHTSPTMFATDVAVVSNLSQCEDEWPWPLDTIYLCFAEGGGLAVRDGSVVATRMLVAANEAHLVDRAGGLTQAEGGGIYVGPGGSVDLLDSLVAFNKGTSSTAAMPQASLPAIINTEIQLLLMFIPGGKYMVGEMIGEVLGILADLGINKMDEENLFGDEVPAAVGGGVYTEGELILGGTTRITGNRLDQKSVEDSPASLGAGLYRAAGSSVVQGRYPNWSWTGGITDNLVELQLEWTCDGAECTPPRGVYYCIGSGTGYCSPTTAVTSNCAADGTPAWTTAVPPSHTCVAIDLYRPSPQDDTVDVTGTAAVPDLGVFANDLESGVFVFDSAWRVAHAWQPGKAYESGDFVVPSTATGPCTGPTCRVYRITSVATGADSGPTEPAWPTADSGTVMVSGITYKDITRTAAWYEPSIPVTPEMLGQGTVKILREPRHGTAEAVKVDGAWHLGYTPDPASIAPVDDLVYELCLDGGYRAWNLACNTATVKIRFVDRPQPQVITFTSTPVDATYGGIYTPTATGGQSGNPVIFSPDPATASVCTVSGSTVTFTGTGWCVLTASQAGNDQFGEATPVQQWVTVMNAPLTVTAPSPTAVLYGGPVPTLEPVYEGFVLGDTPATALSAVPTCSTTYTQGSAALTYPTTCTQVTASHYAVKTVPGTLVIGRAPLVVRAPSPAGVEYGDPVPQLVPEYEGLPARRRVAAAGNAHLHDHVRARGAGRELPGHMQRREGAELRDHRPSGDARGRQGAPHDQRHQPQWACLR